MPWLYNSSFSRYSKTGHHQGTGDIADATTKRLQQKKWRVFGFQFFNILIIIKSFMSLYILMFIIIMPFVLCFIPYLHVPITNTFFLRLRRFTRFFVWPTRTEHHQETDDIAPPPRDCTTRRQRQENRAGTKRLQQSTGKVNYSFSIFNIFYLYHYLCYCTYLLFIFIVLYHSVACVMLCLSFIYMYPYACFTNNFFFCYRRTPRDWRRRSHYKETATQNQQVGELLFFTPIVLWFSSPRAL